MYVINHAISRVSTADLCQSICSSHRLLCPVQSHSDLVCPYQPTSLYCLSTPRITVAPCTAFKSLVQTLFKLAQFLAESHCKKRDWSCLPAISCDFSTMSPSPNKRPLVALGADQICYYGQNHQNRYVQGSISNPPLACEANTVYVEMLSVANSSRISDATLKKGGGGLLMPLIVDVGGCVYRTNASTEDVFDVRKRVLLRILFGHAL